ncbi:MAG: serine hydrolase domain-containing protein [Pseudomonadota bacterium]
MFGTVAARYASAPAPHYKTVLLIAALSMIVGCAGTIAVEPDDALARTLAKMQDRPTSTELAWRQPKEAVEGTPVDQRIAVLDVFPSPVALDTATEYSAQHSGLGLMVWHNGHVVAAEFAPDITARTPFSAYSMHKSVFALALLAAIEDGYIESLDDPVGSYIAEWRRDPRGAITLRQLLTHSSGLAHFPISAPESMQINFSGRMRAAALAHPLDGEPGELFQYSNVNSLVAGIALQDALARHGQRYAAYLSRRLWKPLNNANAALWLDQPGGVARYHSGLEAGLADWLNVGIMLASDGMFDGRSILSPESIDELTVPSAKNAAYGLHIWLGNAWQPIRSYGPGTPQGVLHSAPYSVSDVWFLDGFGGQRVYVVPSARLVIARFGEVDFGYDDSVIVNALLDGLALGSE